MRDELERPGKIVDRSLLFVNTVRFWTMVSVVFGHCVPFGVLGKQHDLLTQIVQTPFRFGTIGFFLISGCLLGSRLRTVKSLDYLKRRVKRLFVPWAFWFTATFAVITFRFHFYYRIPFRMDLGELILLRDKFDGVLIGTAFWFVPNLLIGICVLLVFRRWLYRWELGAGLLLIDLFYAVNIHMRWVPSSHTESVLGFVFYLWLGSLAATHRERWQKWLARVSMNRLAGATLVAAVSALGEARTLARPNFDAMNVLRITNQVFAVLCLLLLVKVGRPKWSEFVDVRRETFGIYLSHTLVLAVVIRVAMLCLKEGGWWRTNQWGLLTLWPVMFVLTYGLCVALTRGLAMWKGTRWMVGVES